MKKRMTVICALLVMAAVLAACGGVTQGANNPDGGTFNVGDIQGAPALYVGNITLIGTVSTSATQDFAIQNENGTFEVLVDYRGSQALPPIGATVSVEGQMSENRPCCGPGFTVRSTHFEAVKQ